MADPRLEELAAILGLAMIRCWDSALDETDMTAVGAEAWAAADAALVWFDAQPDPRDNGRGDALVAMLAGCEEACRTYEEQIAAIEANERAADRILAASVEPTEVTGPPT